MSVRSVFNTLHAAAALLLMVAFFVASLGTAAGLVWLAVHGAFDLLPHMRGRAVVFGALVCLAMAIAGVIILWSLLPRFDRFTPPGPELLPSEHPKLFHEIRRIAARAGEAAPAHVYATNDVNAFVAQRGGIMGLFSHRVMGLGLPLLRVLSVGELRAVLAHEFGHFAAGDTKLGPWVHKARSAMVRVLDNLASASNAASEVGTISLVFAVLHAPFRWFFSFYMSFTQALSRAQEFAADALSARLEGSETVVTALTKVERAALGYSIYLRQEVAPIIAHGFLPPIGAGFAQFIEAEKVATALSSLVAEVEKSAETDRFDSHPPLGERVGAARRLGHPAPATGHASPRELRAIDLLSDVAAVEKEVELDWSTDHQPLRPIGWEQSDQALVKQWRETVREFGKSLAGHTFATLPLDPAGIKTLLVKSFGTVTVPDDEVVNWACFVYSDFACTALVGHGFTVHNRPGRSVVIQRGDVEFQPRNEIAELVRANDAAAWRAKVENLGIADIACDSLASPQGGAHVDEHVAVSVA